MRLFIPTIGQILQLEKEWTVELQDEYRNQKMIERHGANITFPVGTQFSVDRIYVRQGAPEYDSVTFRIVTEPKGRFWVKLKKANEIEFDFLSTVRERHEILNDKGEMLVDAPSAKGLITKIKTGYHCGAALKQMFHKEVIPHMTDWKVRRDFNGHFSMEDLATDVETKTKEPLISPVNKAKFQPISKWYLDRNRDAGKSYTSGSVFGGLSTVHTYKNPSHYWEVDPVKTTDAFNRGFMKTLRKLKGVAKDEELLQHLPKGFNYNIKKEEI